MSARHDLAPLASRTLGRLAAAGMLAAGALALSAGVASAHPLGNLSVNRATEVVVARDAVHVLRVVDRAEIPTLQLKPELGDLSGYAASACAEEAATLRVVVRDSVPALTPAGSVARLLPGQAGLPTLRLECRSIAQTAIAAGDAIRVVDTAKRDGAVGWREMVIRGDGLTLRSSDAPSTSRTSLLTKYPVDALSSPSDQRSADAVAGKASALAPAAWETSGPVAAVLRPVNSLSAAADDLVNESATPAALALLAVMAFALGAAHALAPGHGKTVMALYMAGRDSRSLRSASAVAGTVTATHTSSVLILGVMIGLGTAVAPAAVTLWAGVASGLLVAGAGAALVVRAWRSRGHDLTGHTHRHGHEDAHPHGHDHGHAHAHAHPDSHAPQDAQESPEEHRDTDRDADVHVPAKSHIHSHADDHGDAGVNDHVHAGAHDHAHGHHGQHRHRAGQGVLVSLGAAGGLVPSPSALLLLLGAVAAGRAFLGVGLVVLFGLGMATTLAGVSGIALGLRARLDRVGGQVGRWWRPASRLLPVSSGAVICVIGLGMAIRGLGAG